MNLAELMAEFRADANDEEIPYLWSDDNLVAWANEAEEEACIRKNLIFDRTTEDVDDVPVCKVAIFEGTGTFSLHESIVLVRNAYLVDASDEVIPLKIYDRFKVECLDDDWRTTSDEPTGIIFDDTGGELNCLPEAAYTLYLEVYRTPLTKMAAYSGASIDSPEIAPRHHHYLLHWMLYRAYSKRDVDTFDPNRAAQEKREFEAYFGLRPAANARRRGMQNRPKRNRCWF
jgi:hypothetical protein